jgi:hypothetical protein
MAGVAFAVEGDGVGFATESYAASALYTTLANLSADLWRIRWARAFPFRLNRNGGLYFLFDAFSLREPASTSLENALDAEPQIRGGTARRDKTGGPLSLIEIVARKCGFAGH